MPKLYIDTNVIIDMIENRNNLQGENLGIHASKLFSDAINCKHHLIFSDWMLYKLKKHVIPQEIVMLFKFAESKTEKVSFDSKDQDKAKLLSKDHPDDALHVVLAEKSNAEIITTSNTKHFNQIQTHIPIKKPKQLI
ncbi:hypothetical protein C0585_03835 [Candidatus Woesearchaeota archaeon]|nr:MAG: hypothetical protein C0585_03835 [Candidatus Woesearchaeota archaeon]